MRRPSFGTDAAPARPGSSSGVARSNSMMRLPDEQPSGPSAAEAVGSRPSSKNGSRPSSSSDTSKNGKATLNRLPDDLSPNKGSSPASPSMRPGSSSGAKNGGAATATLSRLPGSNAEQTIAPATIAAVTPVAPAPGGMNSRMRDRFQMSLKIDTAPRKSTAILKKAFRKLPQGESVTKYYDFGDQIHDGGTRGRVLKAFRQSDRKEVVVKVRPKKSDAAQERAWREVMSQILQMRQQNPNILDLHEILEDETHFYIVMPMCEGGELFNFLVTEAEVPESECKRIIREILQALGHLHDNNLIHRDVKPENILFDLAEQQKCAESPKTVKLIDFDTCMEWSPQTPKSKQFVGTPGYIAPEALMGNACPQSDLWSVGVICYILMTGETPWTTIETLDDGTVGAPGANKMFNCIKSAKIDWESEPWPDFPEARDLCQKLMAFEVQERPESVPIALSHPWLAT